MASGIIGNDVPRKGLRVRVPCPPLRDWSYALTRCAVSLKSD
jgi:hypothetical protein